MDRRQLVLTEVGERAVGHDVFTHPGFALFGAGSAVTVVELAETGDVVEEAPQVAGAARAFEEAAEGHETRVVCSQFVHCGKTEAGMRFEAAKAGAFQLFGVEFDQVGNFRISSGNGGEGVLPSGDRHATEFVFSWLGESQQVEGETLSQLSFDIGFRVADAAQHCQTWFVDDGDEARWTHNHDYATVSFFS